MDLLGAGGGGARPVRAGGPPRLPGAVVSLWEGPAWTRGKAAAAQSGACWGCRGLCGLGDARCGGGSVRGSGRWRSNN